MDYEKKARLEQELKFLKESLDADIITQDEYTHGKERIENRLQELGNDIDPDITIRELRDMNKDVQKEDKNIEPEEKEEPIQEEERKDDYDEKQETIKESIDEEEEPIEEKEEVEEIIKEAQKKPEVEIPIDKEEVKSDKPSEEEGVISQEEVIEDQDKKEEPEEKEEKKDEDFKSPLETEEKEKDYKEVEEKEEKKSNLGTWIKIIAIILLAYFLFKSCSTNTDNNVPEEIFVPEVKPECVSDSDCIEPGKLGTCVNPDTVDAKCEFKEDVEVKLTILNDKNCESCDTKRMTQTLKQLFPKIRSEEVAYDSGKGSELLNTMDVKVLPAYIFDIKIEGAIKFEDFKRALGKIGDSYILSPMASGAIYYFRRPEMKNRLELFVLENNTASLKAESNVDEVLELFGNDIEFIKQVVTDSNKKSLSDDLGMTSFPVFLVNNQLKFGGVRSPESIKEKFCELNNLPGCEKTLSGDII